MMGEVLGRRRGGIGAAQGQHLGSGIPESAAGSAAANRLCGSHIDADLTRNGRHWTEIREEGKENRRTRFQPIYYTHIPPYNWLQYCLLVTLMVINGLRQPQAQPTPQSPIASSE